MSLDTYISGKWKFNNTITFTSSGVWSWGFTSNGGTYKRITYNSTDNSMYYYGDTSTSTTDVCVYKQGAWTNQNFRVIDLGTEPVHVFNGGYEFLADRAHSLYVFKRLYDRGAVEMPTILYTPNMDYKKYLILHSRSNYDADAPKDRYYILWFRDDADPVTTYTNSSYMQVQFVNSDTANPVFYCSSSYYTTSALAKEAMQKSTTGYSVPSLVRIFKLQTGTSSTSISLLGYYVNSNSTLRLAISGTKTRDTITGLNYSNVTLTHAFSSETVRATGTPASSFVFHWLSTEQEQLTKPVLTDLSTETQCIFSFPNDPRAYAYKIFVDGAEQPYPLKWTATLTDGIYTVTIADSVFTGEGEYEITAQAYVMNGSYADSDMSDVLIFTKSKPKLAAPVIGLTIPAHGSGENAGGGTIK